MLPLPILNVRLNACHEDWQQMTPTELGHHCARCNRTVLDFTASAQADLELAFRNSPDGRVCGRFRQSQLAPKPQLRPRLRRFLVALVLVCGLGLTSGEAWAQVQKTAKVAVAEQATPSFVYGGAEEMPVYKNGGSEELMKFVQKNVRWPTGSGMVDAEGKVYVSFVVGKDGRVRDAKVLKGIYPTLDAEALRVVQLLDGQFEPGKQNRKPVDVSFTIRVTFKRD